MADALKQLSPDRWLKLKSVLVLVAATLWLATGCSILSRIQLVFTYETLTLTPPLYEILAAPDHQALLMALTAAAMAYAGIRAARRQTEHFQSGLVFLYFACTPLMMAIARVVDWPMVSPSIWEAIWFAAFSGLALAQFASTSSTSTDFEEKRTLQRKVDLGYFWLTVLVSFLAAFWWFGQSWRAFHNFELGFNDFGHFLQRVANTAEGRGFLIESPVLPPFWDHFNPGLLLLVPLWKLWPKVEWIFAVQAGCLALSAILVYSIAKRIGQTSWAGLLWACVWLLHPSMGQMNLAYSYGWHPITIAIPLILAAYRLQLSRRSGWAMATLVLAMSFEEGVIAVTACFAAAMGLRSWFLRRKPNMNLIEVDGFQAVRPVAWFGVFFASALAFVMVYRYSGLAEFQTARFASLGSTPVEILLSPLLQANVFWKLCLRERNFIFTALLVVPLFLPLVMRSYWHWMAIAVPLGILWLWQHLPAQSIAFQYASTLLPILFVAAIEGVLENRIRPIGKRLSNLRKLFCGGGGATPVIAACLTCWVLSFYVGQMPWSRPTLPEVTAKAYGLQEPPLRRHDQEDGKWLLDQIHRVRKERPRVLASGRIASHFVGMPDVETVGQFWQRYEKLAALGNSGESPVRRFDFLMVDLKESFQQSTEESNRLVQEALNNGFVQIENHFGIAILRRSW